MREVDGAPYGMPWRHPHLATSWLRLERAELHRKAFSDLWHAFLDNEADPYEIALNVQDDGTGTLSVYPAEHMPVSDLSLELGEMLYQLRAALDAIVYGLAIIDSGSDPPPNEHRIEFPIRREEPDDFDDLRWKAGPLTDEHWDMIKSVQPYRAREQEDWHINFVYDSLALINDWARIDRHRRLHVVGSWASNANPEIFVPLPGELRWIAITWDGVLEEEGEIATFFIEHWQPGMEISANPNLAIDIALRDAPDPRDDGDTLSYRCRLMCSTVKILLESLEDRLAARPPDDRSPYLGTHCL